MLKLVFGISNVQSIGRDPEMNLRMTGLLRNPLNTLFINDCDRLDKVNKICIIQSVNLKICGFNRKKEKSSEDNI